MAEKPMKQKGWDLACLLRVWQEVGMPPGSPPEWPASLQNPQSEGAPGLPEPGGPVCLPGIGDRGANSSRGSI